MCDVNLFQRERYIWAEYMEENEKNIVNETELEEYLRDQGVDTFGKSRKLDILLRNGYNTRI